LRLVECRYEKNLRGQVWHPILDEPLIYREFAAFAQAAAKLPLRVAFVKKGTPPRLGSVDILPGDRTLLHGKWTTLPELPSSEVS
jgi:hypothetical protein